MDHIENLNKSLEEWAKCVKLTTHQELAKASFLAILKTNSVVSGFSIWLLLISGAATTLIITKLADISTIISSASIQSVLVILILSAIAGFFVKAISLYIDIFLQINENISELFSTTLKEHDSQGEKMEAVAGNLTDAPDMEIDFNLVLNEFTEPLPAWYRTKVFKAAEETAKDPLWGYKRYAKLLLGMGIAAVFQVALFILCVFVVVVSI